ncbi:hypothetical protein [Gordonia sp. NPDC127522]|uniref:hypothetical protein n=1 Tax=Gordonia sp. NPDC127522 TaxID=3345390 RepID=UPI00363ACC15
MDHEVRVVGLAASSFLELVVGAVVALPFVDDVALIRRKRGDVIGELSVEDFRRGVPLRRGRSAKGLVVWCGNQRRTFRWRRRWCVV